MQTIYRNFDEKRYFSLLKSYYHLEKKYGYYNPLTKEYLNFINKNVKEIIKLTFEKVALEYKLNLVNNLKYFIYILRIYNMKQILNQQK